MTEGFFDIHVRLTPRAAATRIGETRAGPDGVPQLMAYVTAVPEKNRANEALIDLLARHYGVPKSAISIVRGQTDRNKVVRVSGCQKI